MRRCRPNWLKDEMQRTGRYNEWLRHVYEREGELLNMDRKHYNVVAAVVFKDGKYFCVRKGRTKYSYTSYKYEFPGGKIEPGETPQEALRRELAEELDYDISVGELLVAVCHHYPDFSITLNAYLCEPLSDGFTLTEHIDYAWLKLSELCKADWAAADLKVVKRLEETGR